jgi:hypothetical protein
MYCPPRQQLFSDSEPRKIVVVDGDNAFAIVRNTHPITVLLYRCKLCVLTSKCITVFGISAVLLCQYSHLVRSTGANRARDAPMC